MSEGLNDDFSKRAEMNSAEMEWAPSPSSSVWRKRLELSGPAEAGRVTSIVRYDPDSSFPPHEHPGGEEVLVLEGVFSDETGDYPSGSYLLNPDGFRHAPSSKEGCLLFVKLRQYPGEGRRHVMLRTDEMDWQPGSQAGVEVKMLYSEDGQDETMLLIRLAPATRVPRHTHDGGEEVFLIEGEAEDEFGKLTAGCWVRYPAGSSHEPFTESGCLLYVKSGHLG